MILNVDLNGSWRRWSCQCESTKLPIELRNLKIQSSTMAISSLWELNSIEMKLERSQQFFGTSHKEMKLYNFGFNLTQSSAPRTIVLDEIWKVTTLSRYVLLRECKEDQQNWLEAFRARKTEQRRDVMMLEVLLLLRIDSIRLDAISPAMNSNSSHAMWRSKKISLHNSDSHSSSFVILVRYFLCASSWARSRRFQLCCVVRVIWCY